jgi:hypothetical protein
LTTNILRRRSMKLVKNVLFSVILVSAMAISTPAGEQQTPGFACTPASTNCQKQTTTGDSTEETGGVTTETSDYLIYEALAALLSVY